VSYDWMNPLLTDMYQIKMTYAEWKGKRHMEEATFEMFFRKEPFKGTFAIFAGHDEILAFLRRYKFTAEHIDYLRKTIPQADPEFFEWLRSLDCSGIRVEGALDGELVFAEQPLLRITGPIALL
jgi:nicotinate phosphoribosyltransferase